MALTWLACETCDTILCPTQDTPKAYTRTRTHARAGFVLQHTYTHMREHTQATAAYRLRAWRGVLVALALNARRRRGKRRQAAVAEEHRRTGLLRRGVAALA